MKISQEAIERMAGLITINQHEELLQSATHIKNELEEEGFSKEEILDFIIYSLKAEVFN